MNTTTENELRARITELEAECARASHELLELMTVYTIMRQAVVAGVAKRLLAVAEGRKVEKT